MVSKAKYQELLSQTEALKERDQAQRVRIENLRQHARSLEEQLLRTEEELAQCQMAGRQRAVLPSAASSWGFIPPALYHMTAAWSLLGDSDPSTAAVGGQQNPLQVLTAQFPELKFDPGSQLAKLREDIVFAERSAQLPPSAENSLRRVAIALSSPVGRKCRLLISGHADDPTITDQRTGQAYPDPFTLSVQRALAVQEKLRQLGVDSGRITVLAFGDTQPVAPRTDLASRSRNRRVELLIIGPDYPLVGSPESIPTLY